MARKFLTPIDLNSLELQNAVIHNLASDPTGVTGRIYFNTGSNALKIYNGSAWVGVGSSPTAGNGISVDGSTVSINRDGSESGLALSSSGIKLLLDNSSGGNTSGLVLSSSGLKVDLADGGQGLEFGATGIQVKLDNSTNTTSGLALSSSGIRVDVATTSGLTFDATGLKVEVDTNGGIEILPGGSGSGLAINLATTSYLTTSSDGLAVNTTLIATKAYVDGVAQGLDVKQSVRVATVTNGTLATSFENGDTVDGVVLATNDRILIKNQPGVSAFEHGIYVVQASGAPVRADDANTSAKLTEGAFTFVEEGTTNAGKGFVVTAAGTLDTDAVTFSQFSEAGALSAGSGIDITSNFIGIDLATTSGLEVEAGDGLRVDLASGSGLELTSTGLTIDLASGSGLELTSTGLTIDLSDNGIYADSGLLLTTSGLKINTNSTSGLGIDGANILYIRTPNNSGLEVTSSGLAIDLATSSGLNLATAGLTINLSYAGLIPDSGLTLTDSGLKAFVSSGIEINNVGALAIDLATTSGLEIQAGEGLAIDLHSESGIEIGINGLQVKLDNTATTSGLAIGASGLKVDIASGASGLELVASGLSVQADSNGGISLGSGTGLEIQLDNTTNTSSGLARSSSGVRVNASATSSGLAFNASGLTVNTNTTSGLGIDGGNILYVKLQNSPGLNLTSSGLAVQLDNSTFTTSGLALSASGLYVDLATTSGLELVATGLAIDLATTSGLELVAGGLKVDLATTSYLTLDSTGLAVDTTSIARTYRTALSGSSTSYTVTHNLGVTGVMVQVYETDSPYATVETDVERATSNTITVKFAVAPTSSAYSVVVIG